MMEEYQSYIITSLDTHTLDFEELKFMRANITAMRLIDPLSYDLTNGMDYIVLLAFLHMLDTDAFYFFTCHSAIHDWELGERHDNKMYRVAPESVKTETALYHGNVINHLIFLYPLGFLIFCLLSFIWIRDDWIFIMAVSSVYYFR